MTTASSTKTSFHKSYFKSSIDNMIARHHNNKTNKVASGPFINCIPCTPSSRLSSSHRHRSISYFNRCRRGTHLKLAKPTPTPLASAKVNGVTPPTTPSGSTKLELPNVLQMPTLKEVNVEEIYNLLPELKGITPGYLRNKLTTLAPQMLAGLQSARIIASKAQLPQELQVDMSNSISIAPITPTHILALASSRPCRKAVSPTQYTLFPIHQLVFAANCSSMPILPSSIAATPEGNTSQNVTLPVVRFGIPSPESFGYLSTYIYTKNAAFLRSSLLPANWAIDVSTIVQKAFVIHGLWGNARAFGIVDAHFYEVIEDCWTEILRSLMQATSLSAPSS